MKAATFEVETIETRKQKPNIRGVQQSAIDFSISRKSCGQGVTTKLVVEKEVDGRRGREAYGARRVSRRWPKARRGNRKGTRKIARSE